MTDSTLLSKIEALLRLSTDDGATEDERDVALKKAHQLMDKHKIDMSRLNPDAYDESGPTNELHSMHEMKWPLQQASLATVMQDLFYVRVLRSKKGREQWLRVIGREEDIAVFIPIWKAVSMHMMNKKAQAAAEYAEKNGRGPSRSWHHAFLRGYIAGLYMTVERLVNERDRNPDVYAIVKVSDSELDEAVKALKPRTIKHTTVKDSDGLYSGVEAAEGAPLNPQIGGGA